METDLIFNRGVDLPEFAAFVLLADAAGARELIDYYEGFYAIALEHDLGLILDTPTWRANRDWGERLGYDARKLADANRRGVDIVAALRGAGGARPPIVLDGL